jgi:hypothetical protein
MKCKNSFLQPPLFVSCFALALLVLLPASGRAHLWSQSSGPPSNGSAGHLTAWEALSSGFALGLERHEQTLKELGQNLQDSEASLRRLTPLYELSLRQNESLKTYNDQIVRRMQESDEWNAELQEDNVKLEAEVKIAKANGLRNAIIAGAGGIALGLLVPLIVKVLRRLKVIPI